MRQLGYVKKKFAILLNFLCFFLYIGAIICKTYYMQHLKKHKEIINLLH